MNLVKGQILDAAASTEALNNLSASILATLSRPPLALPTVLAACDKVLANLDEERYQCIMAEIGIDTLTGQAYLEMAKTMFSAAYLQARIEQELGPEAFRPRRYHPPFATAEVEERLLPLGVLLHVAAGNADGLPAFSVLEGLLTGNINILKLPEVDGGISVLLLQELIQAEPALADYIYVFDYSSKDTASISKLITAADAVVVWGGDVAVQALRGLVPPEIKLIEWGHKLSFAYITQAGQREPALACLAGHICQTNQLLCSSCQGIYLDTEDVAEVEAFCARFLPILEQAAQEQPANWGIGTQAQVTLQLYTQELLAGQSSVRLYRGRGCSLLASADRALEPSLQFRNCWVKPLPRAQLLAHLRPQKNHLQTVGLLCGEAERTELEATLMRTGLVRITDGAAMSASYCGAAHDGEQPLRRYTRLLSIEQA